MRRSPVGSEMCIRDRFKNSQTRFNQFLKVIADKGYQGIAKLYILSETPIKKSKKKKLTKDQKKYSRELHQLRIAVEHFKSRLKICKKIILSLSKLSPNLWFKVEFNCRN